MLSSTETIVPKRISTEDMLDISLTYENKGMAKFNYIRHFIRDFTIGIKFFCDQLNLIDSLYTPLNPKIQSDSKEESQYHDFIGQNVSNFLNDFHKMKKVFFLDIVNRLSEKLDQVDRTDLMTAYLAEENMMKDELKEIMRYPFHLESPLQRIKVERQIEDLVRIIGHGGKSKVSGRSMRVDQRKSVLDDQIVKNQIQVSGSKFRVTNNEKRPYFRFNPSAVNSIQNSIGEKQVSESMTEKNKSFKKSNIESIIASEEPIPLSIRRVPDTFILDNDKSLEGKPNKTRYPNTPKLGLKSWKEKEEADNFSSKVRRVLEPEVLPSPRIPSICNYDKYQTESKVKVNATSFSIEDINKEEAKQKDWALSPRDGREGVYVGKNMDEIMKNFSDYKNTMSLEEEYYNMPKDQRFTPNKIKPKKPTLRPEVMKDNTTNDLKMSFPNSDTNSYIEIDTEKKMSFGYQNRRSVQGYIKKYQCHNKKGTKYL